MTVNERVAYIKGLAEGMKLDTEKGEGKLISEMLEVLEDIGYEMTDLEDEVYELEDQVEAIDEDLGDLEDDYYEDECDCCSCCDAPYEVVCPSCGETIYLDEDDLDCESIDCPFCGEKLELDLEDIEEETEEDK